MGNPELPLNTMSSKKSLPYKVDQEYDIINILKHRNEIPYHSRRFMWEPTDGNGFTKHIVREALAAWRSSECYWLGIVILYTGGAVPAVSDAQHRLTVYFLMILTLAEMLSSEEPLGWISSYGGSSILSADVPAKDQGILDKYEWSRFPNIESRYENDFVALGNLLNGKPTAPENKKLKTTSSYIYAAYDDVKDLLYKELREDADAVRRKFLNFLHNDIKVLRIVISDWRFTIRVFNSFNNIKVSVPPSYLLKNRITEIMGEERGAEVHKLFLTVPQDDQYEQTVHLLTNMMVGSSMKLKEYTATISTLQLGVDPLTTMKQAIVDYGEVCALLESNPYYRMLQGLGGGCEIRSLCLIPICYKAFKAKQMDVPESLCRALVAYGVRSGRAISFNAKKFQEPLITLMTDVLSGRMGAGDAVSMVKKLLLGWLDEESKNKNDLIAQLAAEYWERAAFQRARAALLYLVEKTDSHESRLDHNAVQIDHVYPKTPSKSCPPLANPAMMHRIGNFTPFVGKNTAGGEMKGNMSLGNKSFALKQPYYAKSNIAMTRELATYTAFADAEIEERSVQIARRLVDLTAEDLK
jgi:hypothetical protein